MTEIIVVISTASAPEDAAKIGRHLVERRLAACVTILPGARSIYRWKSEGQDQVEEATESVLLIKTSRDLFPALEAAVKSLHSYEVPEVIALPIVIGSNAYMNWLHQELKERI